MDLASQAVPSFPARLRAIYLNPSRGTKQIHWYALDPSRCPLHAPTQLRIQLELVSKPE